MSHGCRGKVSPIFALVRAVDQFMSFSSSEATLQTMATARPCLAQLSRLRISTTRKSSIYPPARFLSSTAPRAGAKKILSKKDKDKASGAQAAPKYAKKKKAEQQKNKKKASTSYKQYDLKDAEQFSLCDAMRYGLCFADSEAC